MATPDGAATSGSARTAFAGAVLGALIEGLGSFGGAYLTYQNQKDQRLFESEQAAYVQLVREAEEYRRGLIDMREAIEAADQGRYAQQRTRLLKASTRLYASYAEARLILEEVEPADAVVSTLFATNEPSRVEDYDAEPLDAAIAAGQDVIVDLLAAGREDVRER